MKSPLLILLLIVNLLACPLRCLSCGVNTERSEEIAPAACACCSHDDEAPVSETPEPCEDDCNCQNCICDGAVIDAAAELPDADFLVSWVQPMLLATRSFVGHCEFLTRRACDPCGYLQCGRDRCAAHQSWLI